MRQILSKGQLVVCWALGLWCSFLLVAWFAYTENILGLILPALVIAGLALLTLELRKRKPQKEGKPVARGKLASRIISVSLLIIAVALTVVAIKMTVGAPPTKERDLIDYRLLEARVDYIARNPNSFLDVRFYYEHALLYGRLAKLPEGVDVKGKIFVEIFDTRDVFSDKSGMNLLEQFKRELEHISLFIIPVTLRMHTTREKGIVAKFYSRERTPLGYFYRGEYHLWEE